MNYRLFIVVFFIVILVIAWVRIVVVVMVRVAWICCMCWVIMHWVVMMHWIMMSRIIMSWRNRVIWMSPTMLSSIIIMSVIVSHIFSSFRFRYRLCYKRINSLRRCLYASQIAFTTHLQTKKQSPLLLIFLHLSLYFLQCMFSIM